jgi:hypothetical protein
MSGDYRLKIVFLTNILMEPFSIVTYATTRLALRVTRETDSFRIGKILSLIMPD